jgi:hypothetical protein
MERFLKRARIDPGADALRKSDAESRRAFKTLDLDAAPPPVVGLQACPGAGKTTITLDLIAANPHKRFLLMYFNRAMKEDAAARAKKRKLTNVDVRTIDAVARGMFTSLTGPPAVPSEMLAKFKEKFEGDGRKAHRAWKGFVKTPDQPPREDRFLCEVVDWVDSAVASGEWWDFTTLTKLMHVNNMWSSAVSEYDVVIVDEAQDMKPVVVEGLRDLHGRKPVVYVGDGDQALYAYDGAINAFEVLAEDFTSSLVLNGTYRFGQSICDYVNGNGCASHRMVSLRDKPSRVVDRVPSDVKNYTYIFRGNMEMLRTASVTPRCHVTDLAGKVKQVLQGKRDRLEDTSPDDPRWAEIDTVKKELERLSKAITENAATSAKNGIVFCTVHGFKGNEAATVRVARDVFDQKDRCIKLVAVTRATELLII